jgi:hypothetical protein
MDIVDFVMVARVETGHALSLRICAFCLPNKIEKMKFVGITTPAKQIKIPLTPFFKGGI